eukprot:TRINITY_DN5798_c0_g3_i6.p1 TRINITY_DN5798_c0_g3~~TRINITY_DN5798_c0_g3_i6.p1  ORF type:complete len:222 (-),score=46.04 TRINITY_DN5798_c0_g3_i6:138-803(-)
MSQKSPRPKSIPAPRLDPITLRLVIVGETGSGKTSLVSRFTEDLFQERFVATVGVDFKTRFIEVGKYLVTVQIWDTAGQERFRSITNAYYHGSDGIILAYDICRKETYNHIPGWLDQVQLSVSGSVPIMVVGLKADKDSTRTVSMEEAKEFAEKNGLLYSEASAATGTGVTEAFTHLCDAVLKRKGEAKKDGGEGSKPTPGPPIVKVVAPTSQSRTKCPRC